MKKFWDRPGYPNNRVLFAGLQIAEKVIMAAKVTMFRSRPMAKRSKPKTIEAIK